MSKPRKSRILDMTQGSPAKLLLQFAMPLFLGNLMQQFYNLADTAIAGHLLGDAALAQIGATAALYSLITNFAFGMNSGLALTVSRCFGAGDKTGVRRAACWMVTLSLCTAAVLTASLYGLRRGMLAFLQVPQATMDGALAYLAVILLGIPLTMAYNLESAMLQAVGNSITPLFFLLFSSVLNIGLDVAFMGPLGLGVRGAAIATVLAQGISTVLGGWYILRGYPELRFTRSDYRGTGSMARGMLWAGLSMGLMTAIYNIGSVVLQSSINALGNVYIAAQVAGRRLAELFYIPGTALGIAIATYSSQNFGAGRYRRIMKGAWVALGLYLIWWVFATAYVFTLGRPTVQAVTGSSDEAVLANALLYLQISIPMIPPMAVIVIFRNMLQGIQHTIAPLFSSALELIGKLIFGMWLVPVWGYPAVCICEPVTWVICCVFISFAVWRCRAQLNQADAGSRECSGSKMVG